MMNKIQTASLAILILACNCIAADTITPPPDSLEVDPFYQKHLDAGGIPIVTSQRVTDAALFRTKELIDKMLADRPDVRKAMVESRVRFVIIGANEQTTDIPEYSHMEPKEFWNWRARGFGGRVVSCGEENILCYPVDRYDDESIMIHEFAHTIHGYGLKRIDPEFQPKLERLYKKAIDAGLWVGTYAASNVGEYWAEAVQSYYDANRQNNYNHNHVDTREELQQYDPELAAFVAETFRHTRKSDWRYIPIDTQPKVTSPPQSLDTDPFYTKYVRAKGLPILASKKVNDQALLEANNIVRQMFAYRYDILKDMIDANLRVIIIAENEELADLPEIQSTDSASGRYISPTRQRKLIVCPQENLLASPTDKHPGQSILIGQLARALYVYTGLRPIDPNYESKQKQQFELGLDRIDIRFDKKLRQLCNSATKKGLYKDTPHARNHRRYWVDGVKSWFDANHRSSHAKTREDLEKYDPDLAALIAETFRHNTRVDWRYQPPAPSEAR